MQQRPRESRERRTGILALFAAAAGIVFTVVVALLLLR